MITRSALALGPIVREQLHSRRVLWWWVRGHRVGVRPGTVAVGYSRGTMAVPLAFVVATIIEIGVLHLVVPWGWMRWTLLVLSLYSAAQLLAWSADRVVHPHLVTETEFVVRSGRRIVARVNRENVRRCVRRRRFQPTEAGVDGDVLFLPGPDGTELEVVFDQVVDVSLPAFFEHRRRTVTVRRIALHVDDPSAACSVLGTAVV